MPSRSSGAPLSWRAAWPAHQSVAVCVDRRRWRLPRRRGADRRAGDDEPASRRDPRGSSRPTRTCSSTIRNELAIAEGWRLGSARSRACARRTPFRAPAGALHQAGGARTGGSDRASTSRRPRVLKEVPGQLRSGQRPLRSPTARRHPARARARATLGVTVGDRGHRDLAGGAALTGGRYGSADRRSPSRGRFELGMSSSTPRCLSVAPPRPVSSPGRRARAGIEGSSRTRFDAKRVGVPSAPRSAIPTGCATGWT